MSPLTPEATDLRVVREKYSALALSRKCWHAVQSCLWLRYRARGEVARGIAAIIPMSLYASKLKSDALGEEEFDTNMQKSSTLVY